MIEDDWDCYNGDEGLRFEKVICLLDSSTEDEKE